MALKQLADVFKEFVSNESAVRGTQRTADEVDAGRYRKLRGYMGRNQKASWHAVETLAAVACYGGNRGSNYWDGKVTEYDVDDPEIEVIFDLPLRAYLAAYVPLASEHPSLAGEDLRAVLAEYGIESDGEADTGCRADHPGR